MATEPSNPASSSPSSSPNSDAAWVDLEHYKVTNYDPGGLVPRVLWYFTSMVMFDSPLPIPSRLKCMVLRWFGAKLGEGVVIKPWVRIKFPWKLKIDSFVWIGEGTWIDNLAEVRIGSHVCVSQGVYFCCGSHDHRRRGFDLITSPITIEQGAWIATRSTLIGGVTIGANALVAACSMVHKDVPAGVMVGGNPAKVIRDREPPVDRS
ncbi:WcaF family extracellular polysaccharide biosynthesis acetyltransferase [Aeoliella mucimassa]|uniref:Maltose O-acetyltransferase n=1 Tax=Aeoliella mucimassa TaxID=2527972 RepID=A0A518AUV8_9BACT|nr:WcaF family extracellular polysaccharide biosynthesis acetyltransferase [Aeoliella mucimassa]QDU58505.1 Maltose O-acetyltransferase [Aeoliella mucimassa]